MKTSPHILMIVQRHPPDIGGLARSGARIAASLAKLDLHVDVLAWTRTLQPGVVDSQDLTPDAVDGRVEVHRLGLFHNWDLSMQHTLNVLEWLHDRAPFDVVWGHYLFPPGFLAVYFGESKGIPTIVSARGNDVDQLMFPPGDFARLTWTLSRARVITAVSRDLARKIGLLLGRDPEVIVAPNAVDTACYAPGPGDEALRAQRGIQPDEGVLCFSGELRHKKGFPFLLSSFGKIREARPACLLVIGEVRPREQSQLAHYRAQFPENASRIRITGHLDDPKQVADHLRLADLFLMPSMWDGLPNALVEAMACGRCALASDAGGIPEVIEHGKNGFMIPRAQLNHLGEAIQEALSLPQEDRDRIGVVRAIAEYQCGVERLQFGQGRSERADIDNGYRAELPRTQELGLNIIVPACRTWPSADHDVNGGGCLGANFTCGPYPGDLFGPRVRHGDFAVS